MSDRAGFPAVSIKVFGPFELKVNGVPIENARYRKGHWLLTKLLLQNGRSISRTQLAGDLWYSSLADGEEHHARESLRQTLRSLRQALGEQAERLRVLPGRSISFDANGVEADILIF